MFLYRSVSEEERAFALGLQFVILRLLGELSAHLLNCLLSVGIFSVDLSLTAYIPAPILFGSVIDSSCMIWRTKCGGLRGTCLLYDLVTFRHKFVGQCCTLAPMAWYVRWPADLCALLQAWLLP